MLEEQNLLDPGLQQRGVGPRAERRPEQQTSAGVLLQFEGPRMAYPPGRLRLCDEAGSGADTAARTCVPCLWPGSGAALRADGGAPLQPPPEAMPVLAQEAPEETRRRKVTTLSLSFLISDADGTLAVLGTLAWDPRLLAPHTRPGRTARVSPALPQGGDHSPYCKPGN